MARGTPDAVETIQQTQEKLENRVDKNESLLLDHTSRLGKLEGRLDGRQQTAILWLMGAAIIGSVIVDIFVLLK